jgi:D-3-phosphoglycerate dehydrogenase / 2-oxoglutarate reductase
MTWRVLCAAIQSAIPNDDVSIEAAELARVDAEILPRVCHSEAEIIAAAPRVDGLLSFGVPLTDHALAALSRCRAVVTVSHGFNHIDVDAATERGIPVSNTYFCQNDVANHTLLLLLACARRLTPLHVELAAGRWRRDLLEGIPPIYGQTLGLIGFGHIGRAVARRAQAFDLEVLAYDPFVERDLIARAGARPAEFDDLLRRSDFVSLHVPLSDRTRHMLGERELGLMRPSAFLLNTARGGLVDEQALLRALTSGSIAGAGLDVFEKEPPDPTHPLLGLANVVHTPHSAGTSAASYVNGRRSAAAAMAEALSGRWPPHVVNPEVRGNTRFPFVDGEDSRT